MTSQTQSLNGFAATVEEIKEFLKAETNCEVIFWRRDYYYIEDKTKEMMKIHFSFVDRVFDHITYNKYLASVTGHNWSKEGF